jgi:hypothetical protein
MLTSPFFSGSCVLYRERVRMYVEVSENPPRDWRYAQQVCFIRHELASKLTMHFRDRREKDTLCSDPECHSCQDKLSQNCM